jgi:small subunit ribosomal protein S16
MLVIRLQRRGKRNQPYFRIVAADSRRHVKAKVIQILGNFNPRSKELNLDKQEITKLLDQGAQLSNRLARLLKPKLKDARIKVSDRPARKPKASTPKQSDKPAKKESSNLTLNKQQKGRVESASKNRQETNLETQ